MSRVAALIVAGAIAGGFSSGCSDPAAPPESLVATLTITAGDQQLVPQGSLVAIRPSVVARDAAGIPVPNVRVRFATASRSGRVIDADVATDANGTAAVGGWELGPATREPHLLTASSGSATATFRAAAYAAPATIVATTGQGQIAQVGLPVPIAPVFRVEDVFGNPVPGVSVTFFALDGGSVNPGPAMTGIDGTVLLLWTLSQKAGLQRVQVRASHASGDHFAEIGVTAVGAPAEAVASIQSFSSGARVAAGADVAFASRVVVYDRFVRPLSHVEVTFTPGASGGTIEGAVQRTNEYGIASVGRWELGPALGPYSLSATAGAVTTTVQAIATSGPVASVAVSAGDGQRLLVGDYLQVQPTIVVSDAEGRPVANTNVQWTASPQLRGQFAARTNDKGESSYCCAQFGTAGVYTVTARAGASQAAFNISVLPLPTSVAFVNRLPENAPIAVGTSIPMVIRVTLAGGAPAAGYPVQVDAGGYPPSKVVTDADGIARSNLTLAPEQPGPLTLVAKAQNVMDTMTVFATGDFKISSIAAGESHTCAKAAPSVYCWGSNAGGQIGDGSAAPRRLRASTLANFTLYVNRVSASGERSCRWLLVAGGRRADTRVAHCWGRHVDGSSGSNTPVTAYLSDTEFRDDMWFVPGYDKSAFDAEVELFEGTKHACALSYKGTLYCWGSNTYGQLGDGTTTDRATPVRVAGGIVFRTGIQSLGVGAAHTCAVGESGQTWCWGRNDQGQLGDGSRVARMTPGLVAAPAFTEVAAGGEHSCGVAAGRALYCWGSNSDGQLGIGSAVGSETTPRLVPGGESFLTVTAGGAHSCAIAYTTRFAFCWGRNTDGQLGDGTQINRNVPTKIAEHRP